MYYFFNLIKIAIPNKISKIPTTIKQILKIFVNSKSKSEVVTVEESVEEVVPLEDVFVEFELLRFISTAAKAEVQLDINIKAITKTKTNLTNFDICKYLL